MDEVAVNWCPGLGTVLANEEVIDGKSEVGGFPVERRPMRQWMLRITAYADRLLDDLDLLEWPESLKEMQRNWIGKSVGAEVDFEVAPAAPSQSPSATRAGLFPPRPVLRERAGVRVFPKNQKNRRPSPSSPPGRTRCMAPPTWSWRPSMSW